jgi:flagellin-specific chaperone FliS
VLDELGRYMEELESLHESLAESDAEKLQKILSLAREVRGNWKQY